MFLKGNNWRKPSHAVRMKLGISEKGFGTFGSGRVPGSMSGIGAVVNQPITEALPSSELSGVVRGTTSEAALLKGW